jgi:hypothetical protein
MPRRLYCIDVARSWKLARQQYAALVAELAEVKRERDEFRAALRLAELYRERAIARARTSQRDPNAALN